VGEDLDVGADRARAPQHGGDGRHHALGLIGGGRRRLGGHYPPGADEHRIGERPADIDAQQHVSPVATARRSRAAL